MAIGYQPVMRSGAVSAPWLGVCPGLGCRVPSRTSSCRRPPGPRKWDPGNEHTAETRGRQSYRATALHPGLQLSGAGTPGKTRADTPSAPEAAAPHLRARGGFHADLPRVPHSTPGDEGLCTVPPHVQKTRAESPSHGRQGVERGRGADGRGSVPAPGPGLGLLWSTPRW